MLRLMTIFAASAVLGFALVGCAAAPTIEDHAATCDGYGFQRGTEAHAVCIQGEALAYQQERQARGAALQRAGAVMIQQSQAQRAAQTRPQPVYPYVPVVNCFQTAWGTQCR